MSHVAKIAYAAHGAASNAMQASFKAEQAVTAAASGDEQAARHNADQAAAHADATLDMARRIQDYSGEAYAALPESQATPGNGTERHNEPPPAATPMEIIIKLQEAAWHQANAAKCHAAAADLAAKLAKNPEP